MFRPFVILLFALPTSIVTVAVLWLTEIPLGVPGEWVWSRIPYDSAAAWDLIPSGMLCGFVAFCYLGFVLRGFDRIASASRFSLAGWLSGLTVLGFFWLFAVQLSPPAPYGLSKSAWVLYYPMASGYFHEARFREEPVSDYLADYEADIQTDDPSRRVLHHGTHPPGLFLAYRGLIRLCESSPGLVRMGLAAQPPSVVEMFDEIETRQREKGISVRGSDRSVIWLATLLTQLCGAAVVIPLFFLARHFASPRSAWIASAFWPLFPTLAVFLPKSDVLYAFLGMSFLAVWSSGWRRKSLLRCFLAGVIFWLGMLLSLAMLPVAFLAAVWFVWEVVFRKEEDPAHRTTRQTLALPAAAACGFLVPTFVFWGVADLNLASVWWQNYRNHAEFYDHFQRSYWPWLWVNPLEMLFAVGAPVVVLAGLGIVRFWKDRKTWPLSKWGPVAAILFTGVLLWVSGKNRGEAARLWLVVFPAVAWLSARFWEPPDSLPTPEEFHPKRILWPMLVLQAVVCWLTVCRVNGFPL